MNVLHLSNTPISNAPWNIAHCQELYSPLVVDLVLGKKKSFSRTHKKGNVFLEFGRDKIFHMFEKADVLHFHNFMFSQDIFVVHPQLIEIAKRKPRLIQYHSPRHSEQESFEDTIADNTIKHAVIAQYHTRVYPECEFIVPNMIPIFDEEYTGIAAKWDDMHPVVSYSPSNANGKGWDDKAYPETTGALNSLQRTHTFTKDVMIGVPYEECMARKRWAHIGIEEFKTGSYHLSSLEYLSMGCALVGRLDGLTVKAIEAVAGEEAMRDFTYPWRYEPQTEEDLKAALTALLALKMPELKKMGDESRLWMERYWNPKNLVKIYERAYSKL